MERKQLDLLITGATAFLPEALPNSFVGVTNGEITYISDEPPVANVGMEIMAAGFYLLPGLIDSHVHFRTPGLEHKEDYLHGSRAAAAGGVTTILDMPNTNPSTYTVQLLREKSEIVKGNSYVDYGFHFLLTKDNFDELLKLKRGDVASVKVFMAGHETAPHVVFDIPYLKKVAKALSERNIMMTVHAEYQKSFPQNEILTYKDYSKYRIREAAIEAVRILIHIADETGCRIHVVHTSTIEEVEMLIQAKKEGIPITFEFIHPHLSFTEEDFHVVGWNLKLSPPLRREQDVKRLWQAVMMHEVDAISSDHAPHTKQEKNSNNPPAGMPGVQETLSAVFTGLLRNGVNPQQAASILTDFVAHRPANLFGLFKKGQIALGNDADLVIFDPNSEWQVTSDAIWSKCEWSPYQGQTLQGTVHKTFLRGKLIYSNGTFVEEPNGLLVNGYESNVEILRRNG